MTDRKPKKTMGRREFLMAAGGGAAVSGTALVSKQAKAEVNPKTGKPTGGYKVTEHVKKYYELSRF